MKRFLVGSTVGSEVRGKADFNIGIAPGKFDAKQLILSSIAVLTFATDKKLVRFVRTVKKEELAKCQLFINDDFTTMFPVIPSYHDVVKQWEANSSKILFNSGICDEEGVKFVTDSVSEKICNLEAIDCLMDLYSTRDQHVDSFESALEVTLRLIEKEIQDSIEERIYYQTIKAYVEKAEANYIEPSIYVQGWRNIVLSVEGGNNIQYAIFPDDDGTLVIEALDKNIIMKKYVKRMPNVSYSGRFFVKVSDMEAAKKVIEKLPKSVKNEEVLYA